MPQSVITDRGQLVLAFTRLASRVSPEKALAMMHVPARDWQAYTLGDAGLRQTVLQRLIWLRDVTEHLAVEHPHPSEMQAWFNQRRKKLYRQSPYEILTQRRWLPSDRDVRRVAAVAGLS